MQKHLIIHLFLKYRSSSHSPVHDMIDCSRKPGSQFSCYVHPSNILLSFIILSFMIIWNKNLLVVTDLYFNMFSQSIRIFLQYNQCRYPAAAFKTRQVWRLYPRNIWKLFFFYASFRIDLFFLFVLYGVWLKCFKCLFFFFCKHCHNVHCR